MSGRAPTSAPAGGDRGYKRSWKNLLINKRYQLQFTLFMVGLSTVLMAGLGVWVMKVANETTTVSMSSVRGTPCPKIPSLMTEPDENDEEDREPTPMDLDSPPPPPTPAPAPTETGSDAGSAAGSGSDAVVDEKKSDDEEKDEKKEKKRPAVTLDEPEMTMLPGPKFEPKVNAEFGPKVVAHWQCEMELVGRIDRLERGRMLILWVLIGTGLLLVVGLAVYGIKMTHKVAGPLFKVSLYLAKMRDGRFDKVWNLRKGDQLVEFYDHFKTAHAGVVQMQKDDIAKLKAVVAAAEAANLGDNATVVAMREMLARKEKSIE